MGRSPKNGAVSAVSAENGSANGLSPDDNHEEGVGSGSLRQANIGGVRVESPGGLSSSTRKGYGLKKWRRIKRDSLVKDGVGTVDCSKVLKRGSMGPVNPPSKSADLSSIEARQSSEGSVGSVNMVSHPGLKPDIPGSSSNVGQVFSASVELETSEDHNSKVECAKNAGGKNISGSLSQRAQQGEDRIDTIKKVRRERVEAEKENPSSSLDSDLRSSNFVFSSGAFSFANSGRQLEVLLNHSGEYRKEGRKLSEKTQNGHRNEKGEREDDLESELSQLENDLLVDSIRSLAAVQEALEKEVQNFWEIGRESILLYRDIDELGSSEQPAKGYTTVNNSSATSESEVLILKHRVNNLENEQEEAKAMLDAKEAKIRALESSKVEGMFQRRMEAEIEHLLVTRSLAEGGPRKMRDMKEGSEQKKPGNITGKACKSGTCFLTQLVLLVCMIRFFILQWFLPDSQIVIPT